MTRTNILDIFPSFFLKNTREDTKYSLRFLRNLTKKSLRILRTSEYKMCCLERDIIDRRVPDEKD